MKPERTKPVNLTSICMKMLTAVLMFVAAAAVTIGLSARTAYAEVYSDETYWLAVGKTMTFKASQYSQITSSNSKVVKVTQKNGKYILTAKKSGSYNGACFGLKSAKLQLYKDGEVVRKFKVMVCNQGQLLYVGKSRSYKMSKYSKVTSSNPEVVSVTKENGKYVVSAVKEGTAVVRLYQDGKISDRIEVMAAKESSVTVDTSAITMNAGETLKWSWKRKSSVKAYLYANYSSGNPSVAETGYVDGDTVKIRAREAGKTTLSVVLMADNAIVKTYKIKITVK